MMEVYVNYYISLAIPQRKNDLGHIANAMMHGMHRMIPDSAINDKDPISEKKVIKKDGQWRVEKCLIG